MIHWTLWADLVLGRVPSKTLMGVVMVTAAAAAVPAVAGVVRTAQTLPHAPDYQVPPLGWLADRQGRFPGWLYAALLVVLVLPLVLASWASDARTIGPLAIALGLVAAVNLIGGLLVFLADWWSARFGMPSLFRAMRLKRIPVYLLLLAWLVLNSVLIGDPTYYRVATTEQAGARVSLDTAYAEWKRDHVTESNDEVVPLVIVAAEGGGLRAAYWTERGA